jgi:STE24 endopeptidase
LAEKIKFPLAKIYVVEGSARSAHSNAYFYGFFKAKRIVLYDTLIKGYTIDKKKDDKPTEDETTSTTEEQDQSKKKADKGCDSDEVLAVLCHEFGHWFLNHNLINLCISFVCINIQLLELC